MKKPDYVYVTYIASTVERVWQALVDPDLAKQYWGGPSGANAHANVSDWQPGSRWEHQRADDGTVDITGKVVESSPPHRLVITWARPDEAADDAKHSRVTFEIEAHSEGIVRLTVTHDELERDAKMLAAISGGWPMVLSNLKTFLETGRSFFAAKA